jgi:hypothetical protein
MHRRNLVLIAFLFVGASISAVGHAQEASTAELLYQGKSKAGVEKLKNQIQTQPSDQLSFELGTLQFFSALETLAHEFAQHGKIRPALGMIPFLRMDVGENTQEEPIDYEGFRQIISNFQSQLDESFATLANVKKDDVKLTIDLTRVHLDMNQDGVVNEDEELMSIVSRAFSDLRDQDDLVVDFDRSDAIWLQGYCSLASALCDFALSLDFSESWQLGAGAIFSGATPGYKFQELERPLERPQDLFIDLIAAIHKSQWKVTDRNRMIACHTKLLRMVDLSRKNWESINAETDQGREWLPSATQHGFHPRLRVNPIIIDAWHKVLAEWEAMLLGKKLVPFWRGNYVTQGLNLKRMFYELEEIDLIMIIQGAPMVKFLEKGPIATKAEWEQLTGTFQGNFIGFAVWAN